jgi:aspartate ammonia-lyase
MLPDKSKKGVTEANMKIRLEKDSLGEMEVPANVYYGPQTARAVRNFPVSALRLPPEMITATAFIKAAAARSHRELGLLDRQKATAIVRAAQEVSRGELKDEFVVDVFQAGAGTSFHMNINEVIANRACELLGGKKGNAALVHPNDHVNMAQSTNDVIPTAMRLACLMLSNPLLVSLQKLRKLSKPGPRNSPESSGRTHLQDAVPMRLGQNLRIRRIIKKARLQISASCRFAEIGIGGSAVGTGVNTHPDYRKKMKAFEPPHRVSTEVGGKFVRSNAKHGTVHAAFRFASQSGH